MAKLILSILILVVAILGKVFFQQFSWVTPALSPNLKPILASYQSSAVERYALGFNNLIGASIWVQLLQNSDHRPVKENEVSWEYAQLDTLTTLDPNNTRAYSFGAIFISTLRRDKIGGKLLIEKWTKKEPHYWRPWYLLGIHYALEMKDYVAASPVILKASKMKAAPDWLSSLGIRLMSESGKLYPALKTSVELLPQLQNKEAIERLTLRIRSLNYRIQKNQWQEALGNYVKTKRTLPTTLMDLKPYVEPSIRELSSILETEKGNDLIQSLLSEKFDFELERKTKQIKSTTPQQTELLEKVGIFLNH